MTEREQLEAEYKKLAKKADRRLRALESYAHDKHFSGIKGYAYARAMRDIQQYSGVGAKRFDTKAPENTNQLKAKINDIKQFLDAPTSTKTGVKQIYQKRADTININQGTNFSWQDLANYFESASSEKIAKEYGSKTMIMAIGVIKDSNGDIDRIEWAVKHNQKIGAKSEVVKSISKRLLEQGYTYDELFGSSK